MSTNPDQCAVCLESIVRPVLLSDCEHVFCQECISEWCKNSSNCPLCRKPVAWMQDPSTKIKIDVQPVVQCSDVVEQTHVNIFFIVQSQRRLARTAPPSRPDPDYVIVINSSSSSGSSHSSGSINYSDSSSLSFCSESSASSDSESESSRDRSYSPKRSRS